MLSVGEVMNPLNFTEIERFWGNEKELFEYVSPIVVKTIDPLVRTIVGEKLVYYNIHIWSYKFGTRVGEIHLPSAINNDPHFKAMTEIFLKRTKRGNYNKIFFQLPRIKRDYVLMKGSLADIKKHNEEGIVLPLEIFLPDSLRDLNLLPPSQPEIELIIEEGMKFAIENSTSINGERFWTYFTQKINAELGYDISNYYDRDSIFEMFPPILVRPGWNRMIFIPADLFEGSGVGVSGLYVFVNGLLTVSEIESLHKITRWCFGELAHWELKRMTEHIEKVLRYGNDASEGQEKCL